MSCRHQHHRYRQGITGVDHTSLPMTVDVHHRFVAGLVHHPVPSPQDIHPPPMPPLLWDIFQTFLHDPDPDTRRVAADHLVRLGETYHWRAIPPPTEDDIRVLWPILVAEMIPARGRIGWGPHAISAIMTIMLVLFTHASLTTRQWMWDVFHTTHVRTHGNREPVAVMAIRRLLPIWLLPNGYALLREGMVEDADITLSFIEQVVARWNDIVDTSDPAIERLLRTFVIDGLTALAPGIAMSFRADLWLRIVVALADRDTALVLSSPALIDGIMDICRSDDPRLVNDALHVIWRFRLFDHPRWHDAVSYVVRNPRISSITIRCHAASLILQSMGRLHDRRLIDSLVESTWNTMCCTTLDSAVREAAAVMVRALLEWYPAVASIQPFLATLPQQGFHLPLDLLSMIATASFVPPLTDRMIDTAAALLGTFRHHVALDILQRSWGKGYDSQIMHTMVSSANRFLSPHEMISVMLPGIYTPQIASPMITMISTMDPSHVESYVMRGLTEYYHPSRPISHDILPTIVQMCTDQPMCVTENVLNALWDIDEQVGWAVTERLVGTRSVMAFHVLGHRWGGGMDSQIAHLIERVIRHPHSSTWVVSIPHLIRCINAGVGRADPSLLVPVWERLIHRIPVEAYAMVAGEISHTTVRWDRETSSVVVSMIRALYDYERRAAIQDLGRTGVITLHILNALQNGWGYGCDIDILALTRTIMHDTMARMSGGSSDGNQAEWKHIAHVFRSLRYGWGRGIDASVAGVLCSLLDHLDRVAPGWVHTDLGAEAVVTVSPGGSHPHRFGTGEDADGFRAKPMMPPSRTVIDRIRMIIARRFGITPSESIG